MPAKKPVTDRIADLKAKKDKLTARLNTLEAKAKTDDRKRDTRRKIVVGAAVLAHAELHPQFGELLRGILDKAVLRDNDRSAISDVLPLPPLAEGKAA